MLLTIPCGPSPRDNRRHGPSPITVKRRRRPRHAARIRNRVLARMFTVVLLPFASSARCRAPSTGPRGLRSRRGRWACGSPRVSWRRSHSGTQRRRRSCPIIVVPVTMTIFPAVLAVVGGVVYAPPFAAARLIMAMDRAPIRYLERRARRRPHASPAHRAVDRHRSATGRRIAIGDSRTVSVLRFSAPVPERPMWQQPMLRPSTSASPDDGRAPRPAFEIVAYQNEYLPSGVTEVHAIIEVVACGAHSANRDTPEAAEVILLDCSGSMGQPWSKLRAARHATGVAIDALATAPGSRSSAGSRARRNRCTRPAAAWRRRRAPRVRRRRPRSVWLGPEGGTAMGQWLLLARTCSRCGPSAIPHADPAHGREEREREPGVARERRSARARDSSSATAGESAPTGTSASCARSHPPARHASTSSAIPPSSPTTSGRWPKRRWPRRWRERCSGCGRRRARSPVPQAGGARDLRSHADAHTRRRPRTCDCPMVSIPPARGVTSHASTTSASKSRPRVVGEEMLASRVSVMVGSRVRRRPHW